MNMITVIQKKTHVVTILHVIKVMKYIFFTSTLIPIDTSDKIFKLFISNIFITPTWDISFMEELLGLVMSWGGRQKWQAVPWLSLSSLTSTTTSLTVTTRARYLSVWVFTPAFVS